MLSLGVSCLTTRVMTFNFHPLLPTLLGALYVGLLLNPMWRQQVVAGEICVVCSEPQARYRCGFEADEPGTPVPSGLQLLCIKQLAARGGHKSCSVDRLSASAPCDATHVTLSKPVDSGEASDPGSASDKPNVPLSPRDMPTGDAPPPTVEALAKATAAQSQRDWDKTNAQVKESTSAAGEKLGQAGSAVGTAIKKSFDCVVSLFSAC
jgi:hypothetical protein